MTPRFRIGLTVAVFVAAIATVTTAAQVETVSTWVMRALRVTQGTMTADGQALSTSATWNNAGVSFTGWKEVITDTASAATSYPVQILGGAAGATNLFRVDKSGNIAGGAALSVVSTVQPGAAVITSGSGTGITVTNSGIVQTLVYKVTIDKSACIANSVNCDVTIATLPAKTILQYAVADLTQTFACAAVCTTSTLSITLGKSAGAAEYLASFDADAAAAVFGDAQAELGAALKTITPPNTPLGDLASWSSTQAVVMRLLSGTGVLGTGAATNLSQGSVTFYLVTTRLP